jgi:hypothetical protein
MIRSFVLVVITASLLATAMADVNDDAAQRQGIPEPEYTLIRAIGFIEGPPLIAKTCAKANRLSAGLWDKEVNSFEHRRADQAAQARRIFADTYGQSMSHAELLAILEEKVRNRLVEEAAVNHVTPSTLCLVVSLVGGKKAFETPGFEETMHLLDAFDKAGDYRRLGAKIADESSAERMKYVQRLRAYQMKPAKPAKRDSQ